MSSSVSPSRRVLELVAGPKRARPLMLRVTDARLDVFDVIW